MHQAAGPQEPRFGEVALGCEGDASRRERSLRRPLRTRFGVAVLYRFSRTFERPNGSHLVSFVEETTLKKVETTSNGGPLGSCVDEERSKLRYVV